MADPERTVILNGIVVGAVANSGDQETDIKAVQTLLRDKGLESRSTLPQTMFQQALSFATTSAYLYEKDLARAPRNPHSIVPFVVNSALSIELYLKTLAQFHGVSLRGHEVVALYAALPAKAKAQIESAIPDCAKNRGLVAPVSFLAHLTSLNTAFVEWRYIYEKERSSPVTIQPTIFLMECLHAACRAANVT